MSTKNFFTGMHVSVMVGLGLVMAVLVYMIAQQFHLRIDLTKEELNSLSRETRRVLSEFGDDGIEVFAFVAGNHSDRFWMEDLFLEYSYQYPPFEYSFIDPDRNPLKVKEFLIDKYGVLVIRSRDREVRIEELSEQSLTNALAKILSEQTRRVYFVTGHSEPDLKGDDENGYLSLATLLRGLRYQVQEINLLQNGIPEQADLVMLTGPHVDLNEAELKVLRDYFESGGRLVMALDPVLPGEGVKIKAFLWEFGLDLGNDVIIDSLSKEVGADYLIAMLTEFINHDSIKDFQLAAFFPVARSVRRAAQVPETYQVTELARTSLGSWAETNLEDLEKGDVNYDEGLDLPGPVTLVSIVEDIGGDGKMVVLGDSDALNNANLNLAGNRSFFTQIIGWLLEEQPLVNVKIKEAPQYLLFLNDREESVLFIVPVVVVPSLFLLSGFFVHFRRKRHY